MHYYETIDRQAINDGNAGGLIGFDTLEEAIQYAEENDIEIICEIGGAWDEFKKCWFCGEWKSTDELNNDNLCEHCENYLISRGEI